MLLHTHPNFPRIEAMRAQAQAQPNIALIKYWGKRNVAENLPAVGSLSVTLSSLWTRMSVEFDRSPGKDRLQVNGAPNEGLLPRVSRCLDHLAGEDRNAADVVSESNFPIAAGLASSASAFAALVVAADSALGSSHDRPFLSRAAGRASGSAARSLFGGIAELRVDSGQIDVTQLLAPDDWPLDVIVAVTDESAKAVGSGEAMMRCAESSPFYASWVGRQAHDLDVARKAVAARDFERLAAVAEHNCLKMHSVMWAARPPIVYWNKTTLECMQVIRDLQAAGEPVFFTIDAGPQLKAVCLPDAARTVSSTLAEVPGVSRVLESKLGHGARLLPAT